MSKKVLISMLQQGSNGQEILSILDAITSDFNADAESMTAEPTLEEIDF